MNLFKRLKNIWRLSGTEKITTLEKPEDIGFSSIPKPMAQIIRLKPKVSEEDLVKDPLDELLKE